MTKTADAAADVARSPAPLERAKRSKRSPVGSAIMRWGNASIWLATGLLVLAPGYRAVGEHYLDLLHLPHFLMWITCAAEVALALVIAFMRPNWILTLIPTGMVVSFTAILAVHDPTLLVHPLGILTKNIPILALIWVAFLVHERGWNDANTMLLRAGMAIVWITEGLFPKILFQQGWELAFAADMAPWIDASLLLYVIGALQIASGLLALALRGNALRALLFGQCAALLVLPILVGVYSPDLFVHPFGPLTKNLPILAGTTLALMRVPPSVFLRAEWKRLCMFHFRVPRALAERHLPPGVELDLKDASAWVSFVALEFDRTRVLGVPVPGHVRFGDVNLRLYVRRGDDRGVVFVREIVPLPLAVLVARTLFREPFIAKPIALETTPIEGGMKVVRVIDGRHRIEIETAGEPRVPDEGSDAAFFKERYFAYGHAGAHLRSIRVSHAPWAVRDVHKSTLDVDFRALYGPEWGEVLAAGPASSSFVEGSDVALMWPELVEV
jgi:uncharacterized protein YqjF (DUF2071 family)